MFYLDFDIDDEGQVSRIRIGSRGMTGLEKTTDIKDALQKMKIQNPCTTFSRRMKSGEYHYLYTEEEIAQIAEISNYLADLWQYEVEPDAEGKDMRPYMNPLMILERALNMILEITRYNAHRSR